MMNLFQSKLMEHFQSRFPDDLLKKLEEKATIRRQTDFSQQRNPRLLEALNRIAAEDREAAKQRKHWTRQDDIDSLKPEQLDPLGVALLHWFKQDLPVICQEMKVMVKKIEMDRQPLITETVAESPIIELRPRRAAKQEKPAAKPPTEQEMFKAIYDLLDRANTKELFPYEFSEKENSKLPPMLPLDEKSSLIYEWLCYDDDIRLRTMRSISMHKLFAACRIDKVVFESIVEAADQHWDAIWSQAQRQGIDPNQHIDIAKVQQDLSCRLDFNEAVAKLWRELKLLRKRD